MIKQLKHSYRYLVPILLLFCALAILGCCSVLHRLPRPQTTIERIHLLEKIPNLPLQMPVQVYWNDYMIPFVEAQTDQDAAFMLGLIQAHLRLGQMEVGKRIAFGRISEMIGPPAQDIDAALRALNIPKANKEVIINMPKETKVWLQAFVDGINHYKTHMKGLPHDMKVLGMDNEPWRMEDSLALGRLGGVDVNWLLTISLLPEYGNENWTETWQRLEESQQGRQSSFKAATVRQATSTVSPKEKLAILRDMLAAYARSGSNSFAISGKRSATGAPIIANDPHLGFLIPNLWLIAGLKSPSYHVVGMMPAGVPVFAFGRNEHIAWGGTNMRQEASDFIDITGRQDPLTNETHAISTRFWLDTKSKNRVHPLYGPVLSDVDILPFPENRDIAIRWTGHLPSDETTAMLGIAKATNWQEMIKAADGFSIPGQNFVFATADGDIGHILATWIPKRPQDFPADLFVTPEQSDRVWEEIMTAERLPHIINPESGLIASANNKPYDNGTTRIGWYFSADDRITRIYKLMEHENKLTLQDMKRFQRDTYSISHKQLHDFLLKQASKLSLSEKATTAVKAIESWDGYFEINSREAYLYQSLYVKLETFLYETLDSKGGLKAFKASGFMPYFIEKDFQELSSDNQTDILNNALEAVAEKLDDGKLWGDIHRLDKQYALGNIPILGRRYKRGDLAVPGHNATVFKTAGNPDDEKHSVRYGSQSRHISDFSDINANYFVLFGGQDGTINAANAMDQIPLWQRGEFIHVPFEVKQVKQDFTHQSLFSAP